MFLKKLLMWPMRYSTSVNYSEILFINSRFVIAWICRHNTPLALVDLVGFPWVP
jgi:hypothetical protein